MADHQISIQFQSNLNLISQVVHFKKDTPLALNHLLNSYLLNSLNAVSWNHRLSVIPTNPISIS